MLWARRRNTPFRKGDQSLMIGGPSNPSAVGSTREIASEVGNEGVAQGSPLVDSLMEVISVSTNHRVRGA